MSNIIIEELKTLKDEFNVQSHLFSMDVKDEYKKLEPKVEQFLTDLGEKTGKFNEEFWAGNKEEIEQLINKLKELKKNKKDS